MSNLIAPIENLPAQPNPLMGIGELCSARGDGELPTSPAAGSAPGESGVSVFRARYQGNAHFSATLRQHLICFHMPSHIRIECRVAGRALQHRGPAGSLSICPAGIDFVSDVEGADALLVAIDPGQLALAAAEDSVPEAQLIEHFSGYDQALFDTARTLARNLVPVDRPVWVIVCTLERHTRGKLGKDVLDRLREYVVAHLDEPIEVTTLAKLAGRSPFHFSRVFTRSVGMSPHRYVVHLRLRRAIELVRDRRSGLAEIAACTGFADQSHLSRWVRRVHGVSLTQLVP